MYGWKSVGETDEVVGLNIFQNFQISHSKDKRKRKEE